MQGRQTGRTGHFFPSFSPGPALFETSLLLALLWHLPHLPLNVLLLLLCPFPLSPFFSLFTPRPLVGIISKTHRRPRQEFFSRTRLFGSNTTIDQ
ncbi:hypothetical protein F5H01DRAFT_343051 [Linnemannia elongata]|nr:hypothetical protein F5H01DRAFT_343051 [Linnemannia elongata]